MNDQATVWGYYWQMLHQWQMLKHYKVLIIGRGFVGSALAAAIPNAVYITRDKHGDDGLTSKDSVGLFGAKGYTSFGTMDYDHCWNLWDPIIGKYDLVINTIADTDTNCCLKGIDVRQMTSINYAFPLLIADLCYQKGTVFVNLSTACLNRDVRDSRTFRVEQAEGPYYATKMLADAVLRDQAHVLTLRTRLIYDDITRERDQTPKNLTWRLQKFDKVYDCLQSVTHRQTIVAAIVYMSNLWLGGFRSVDNVYDVVDKGVISLAKLSGRTDVEIVPCDQSIATNSPVRIVEADCSRLQGVGFNAIDCSHGVEQAQQSSWPLYDKHSIDDVELSSGDNK